MDEGGPAWTADPVPPAQGGVLLGPATAQIRSTQIEAGAGDPDGCASHHLFMRKNQSGERNRDPTH